MNEDIYKETFEFREMELKSLVYLCVAQVTVFLLFEAKNFKDEVSARKKMESDFMKIIDDHLDRKRNQPPKSEDEPSASSEPGSE